MPFPLENLFSGQLPSCLRSISDRFTTDGVTSAQFSDDGTQRYAEVFTNRPDQFGFRRTGIAGHYRWRSVSSGDFDASAEKWHLNIVLNRLSLKLHNLHGADFAKESGTTPKSLICKQTDTAAVTSGETTLRFAKAFETDPVVLLFVENQSATDTLANTGAVVSLCCNPPHFFFGSSQFGMSLTELLYDASDTFSPEFITNQVQTEAWGAEATLYAPPNALGRGEFELQWGRAPLDPSTFILEAPLIVPDTVPDG